MTQHPFPVYVGYDIREHAAWQVCAASLKQPYRWWQRGRPDRGVMVQPLAHKPLRREGLFDRPWRIDGQGQFWDERDGRPFSTEFSHSRFLVPHLAMQATEHRPEGERGWAMFVDCDFLFVSPVTDLLKGLDPSKAIYVVKHDFTPKDGEVKMDGMQQAAYERKLWSSMMLFNLDHPKVREINWRLAANEFDGRVLHRLVMFDDDEIGALPESWNFIPGHNCAALQRENAHFDLKGVDAIHWSFGGPWMEGYEKVSFHGAWEGVYVDAIGIPEDQADAYDISDNMPIL